MLGPEILTRTMTARVTDRGRDARHRPGARPWVRSVAGWTLLFDLLRDAAALRLAACEGRLGLQIGIELHRPVAAVFELALTAVPSWCHAADRGPSFHSWAQRLGIVLDDEDRDELSSLGAVPFDPLGMASRRLLLVQVRDGLGSHATQVAALHGNLLSGGIVASRQAGRPISAAYVVIDEREPDVAAALSAALPLAAADGIAALDAAGITVVRHRAGTSEVVLSSRRSALPAIDSPLHYERLLLRLGRCFATRYPLDAPVWEGLTPRAER